MTRILAGAKKKNVYRCTEVKKSVACFAIIAPDADSQCILVSFVDAFYFSISLSHSLALSLLFKIVVGLMVVVVFLRFSFEAPFNSFT